MKKKYMAALMAAALSVGSVNTAFAAWVQDGTGYWWQNEDGTWPVNSWQWLDGNQDGVAECYYFDGNGYMAANTVIEGTYTVNESGAWVADGVVQTKAAEISPGWHKDNTGWRYFKSGKFVTSDWKKIGGEKYYFDEEGYMLTGFQEVDGQEYYFKDSGALQDKTFYMDGYYYVVDSSDDSIIDEVDEYDWREYRQDNDIDRKEIDKTTVSEEELGTDVTEEEAQEKILSMKKSYPEGKKWDNSNKYVSGFRTGYGCAGFAFLVQDKVFGKGGSVTRIDDFDPDNLRIGDHIRLYNNAGGEHSVIILDVGSDEVELVEGNYNSSIHWGRTMSFDELEENFIYQETRY